MSIEGQGHFFNIYFPGSVCFVLYKAKISGERLQDHWSSGFYSNAILDWNNLPDDIKSITNNFTFKTAVKRHLLTAGPSPSNELHIFIQIF